MRLGSRLHKRQRVVPVLLRARTGVTMLHPLVVPPHQCGLPVAMLFLAAGLTGMTAATITVLVLAAKAIVR